MSSMPLRIADSNNDYIQSKIAEYSNGVFQAGLFVLLSLGERASIWDNIQSSGAVV